MEFVRNTVSNEWKINNLSFSRYLLFWTFDIFIRRLLPSRKSDSLEAAILFAELALTNKVIKSNLSKAQLVLKPINYEKNIAFSYIISLCS